MPSATPRGHKAPRRGIEPRLAVSKTAVPSVTPAGQQYPGLESNQDLDLRRVPCHPLHHRDKTRADGWIRTSMRRFTGPLPFCIEPRRHKAGAHRVELCRAALETACSPGSTLLSRVSEGNRTRCLDVHSVACHPATPQTPSTSSPGWIRASALPHVTGMS